MSCIDCDLVRIGREVKVGQPLSLPAGLTVRSLNPSHDATRELKRAQTVTPHFVDRYTDGRVVVTWAGSGGYWQRLEARSGSTS